MSHGSLFDPNPTFVGGVHPDYNKELSCYKPTERMPLEAVSECWIPFQMHIGAPARPLIKKGDMVKKGQMIGEPQGFVSAAVHAPLSGKVTKIEARQHPLGHQTLYALIKNDGKDEEVRELEPIEDPYSASKEEILERIQMAGLAGMGGATFPTHVKLSIPKGESCHTLAINGAECEPYLSCDHRLMLEQTEDLVQATDFLRRFLGAKRAVLCTEDNKADVAERLGEEAGKYEAMEVLVAQTKYPQGAEHSVIKVVTGAEVGPGKLPIHYGVVVQNVGTMINLWRAIRHGEPLIERLMTVTGDCIDNPRNVWVRMGTLFKDIIEWMGGFSRPVGKVISGGPMMGVAIKSLEIPVLKGSSGMLCLSEEAVSLEGYQECIKCAKCVDACYMNLAPDAAGRYGEFGNFELAEKVHVMDCKECGACAYVCPSHRPLVQWFKLAKQQIQRQRRLAQEEARRKAAAAEEQAAEEEKKNEEAA